jgi:hypothetical protein
MAKKYMPKDLFQVGSASVALFHLVSGHPTDEIASLVWQGYASSIIDDGVAPDLSRAANGGITWLQNIDAPVLPIFFTNLQWYLIHHDDQGKRKKSKLFDGLLFARSIEDPDRVEKFQKTLMAYYFGLITGAMPAAPPGWSIKGK